MPRSVESFQPTGARYVDGDERPAYTNRAAKIVAIHPEPGHTFAGKAQPRHVVDLAMIDTGEIVGLALGDNATRVTMFQNMIPALAAEGADAFGPVCLYLSEPVNDGGSPFWAFRSATDEEIAEATDERKAGEGDGDEGDEPAKPAKGAAKGGK